MRSFVFLLSVCCLCMAQMKIVYLKEAAVNEGAVCLDGTPAIYFYGAGSAANSTKWILHFLGGGFCSFDAECYARSQMLLGSSLYWPEEVEYGGPLHSNPVYNPDFYDWNHVLFVYCDGGFYSGNREDPAVYQGHKLYYRGYRNFHATMKDLFKNKGLANATEVFVVGDSAGGMATFYHIDEIKSMMPKSVTRFKAAPFSGVFLYYPNTEGKIIFGGNMKDVCDMQNCTGSLNPRCVAAQAAGESHKCMFAEYTLPYTESLIMPVGSAYDSVGTACVVGAEPSISPAKSGAGNCSAVPGWAECEGNSSKCTKEQWEKIEAYGNAFIERIEKSDKLHQDGNGLFEYNCHTHDVEVTKAWMLYSTNGVIMRDAVSKWYFSDNEPSSNHFYKDCVNHESYSCNPSCSIPVR